MSVALGVSGMASQASAYEWSGLYVGAHGGGVFGDSDVDASLTGESRACLFIFCGPWSPFSFDASNEGDLSGETAGISAGYNYQYQNFIFGAEADINYSNAETNEQALFSILGGLVELGNVQTKLDWYGSVRGRLGYQLSDGLMVYGTGGFAYGRVTNSIGYEVLGSAESTSSKSTETGWTAGGGMEMQLFNSPNLRLKGEYLYTDLGKTKFFDQDLPNIPIVNRDNNASASSDLTFSTVRVGVVWGF